MVACRFKAHKAFVLEACVCVRVHTGYRHGSPRSPNECRVPLNPTTNGCDSPSKQVTVGRIYIADTNIMKYIHLGVSKNRGTPKSSILIGFSITNHPFWGIPIFGNPHLQRELQSKSKKDCRGVLNLSLDHLFKTNTPQTLSFHRHLQFWRPHNSWHLWT